MQHVIDGRFGAIAEGVKDRRGDVGRGKLTLFRLAAQAIGSAIDLTTLHAAASHRDREHGSPVIASAGGFASVQIQLYCRSATELAAADHQRFLEEPALLLD